MLHLAVLLAALPAATVEPSQIPAQGRQAAILTMERAGMVRLQAKGGDGTACSLVDQLRGPFASSGVVGREDCSLDLLLDVGRYKVRLDSPGKAGSKARVSLSAAIFDEVNATPIGLAPGRPVEAQLPEGKQASFWFRVEKREESGERLVLAFDELSQPMGKRYWHLDFEEVGFNFRMTDLHAAIAEVRARPPEAPPERDLTRGAVGGRTHSRCLAV